MLPLYIDLSEFLLIEDNYLLEHEQEG
jgi:hypothetical protein